jgi:hypothetical protein
MILQQNDTIFAKDTKVKVKAPERCDKTCIHFRGCTFPKSCYTLRATIQAKQREAHD